MQFQLDQTIEVLASTPAAVDALLRGKSAAWLNCRKGEGTFSPADVLGHLIYGEMTDWIPRARQILEGRGDTPFEPFDRRGHEPLIRGRAIGELLDRFAGLRQKSLSALSGFALDEEKLALTGTHPELGRVTLRNLIATWAVHDLGHIAQIMRVMANEYREEVGPWQAYLSIL
jgi:DinB superfamily